MQRRWVRAGVSGRMEWTSKRNCALTPRQLAVIFGGLGVVSLGIATLWAFHGAWVVVPFAFIEIAALVAAFVVYGRHAADFDRVVIEPERVWVETACGSCVRRFECQRLAARIVYDGRGRRLIRLAARGEEIEIGRFVMETERAALAKELRASLTAVACAETEQRHHGSRI